MVGTGRMRNQRGSASIEATIALLFFIFAVWAIYALADFCIVQAKVSYAINTTAKEMSQYSYFYYKTGAQKGVDSLSEQSQLAMGAYNQFSQLITGGKEQVKEASSSTDEYVNAVLSGKKTDELKELGGQVKDAGNTLTDIVNNPEAYMKSIVAIGAMSVVDDAKKYVASGLARSMTRRHFGSTSAEADKNLERYGVEGGYGALNFDASRIFMGDEKIQIVVCYTVDVKNVVPFFESKIAICQTAVTNGWLGGDAG